MNTQHIPINQEISQRDKETAMEIINGYGANDFPVDESLFDDPALADELNMHGAQVYGPEVLEKTREQAANNTRLDFIDDAVSKILCHITDEEMSTVTVKVGTGVMEEMHFALRGDKFTGEYIKNGKINWLRDWMPIANLGMIFDVWGVQNNAELTATSGASFYRAADLGGFNTIEEVEQDSVDIDVELLPYTGTDCVYFVQAETMLRIKIGTSNNIARRVCELRIGSPDKLRVMAVMPGDCSVERQLHKKFSEDRLHGEWFSPSENLLAYINGVMQ